MQTHWRRIAIAGMASLAIIGFAGSANAQHHHGGGGFGGGFVGGLAAGALIGSAPYYGGPYYGGYYDGPYGYYGDSYAYGGDCYFVRRGYVDQWGRRVVRRVRVCD